MIPQSRVPLWAWGKAALTNWAVMADVLGFLGCPRWGPPFPSLCLLQYMGSRLPCRQREGALQGRTSCPALGSGQQMLDLQPLLQSQLQGAAL